MVFTPLHYEDVVALVADDVTNLIIVMANMLDINLFARCLGAVYTNIKNVVTSSGSIDSEVVLAVEVSLLQAQAFAGHFGGIGGKPWDDGSTMAVLV